MLERIDDFTLRQVNRVLTRGSARPGRHGKPPVTTPSGGGAPLTPGAAGVVLYSLGQAMDQFTRTPASRRARAAEIAQITKRVASEDVLQGLGSMGGEELISYHAINLGLVRMGGRAALRWNEGMKERLATLQNADGSWVGHHCISGRTACTAMAVKALAVAR